MRHPNRTDSCPPVEASVRIRVATGLALAVVLGAGCGQKGPLFLPSPAAARPHRLGRFHPTLVAAIALATHVATT